MFVCFFSKESSFLLISMYYLLSVTDKRTVSPERTGDLFKVIQLKIGLWTPNPVSPLY